MVLAGVLIALLCLYAGWLFLRGHYVFAIFIGLFGLYELAPPIAFLVAEYDAHLLGAVSVFRSHATAETVVPFTGAVLAFLALAGLSYFAAAGMFPASSHSARAIAHGRLSDFSVLVFAVFLFGVVSVLQDAGTTRLLDYLGEGELVTPYYFYGGTLLIAVVVLMLYCLKTGRWACALVLLIAVAPLTHELFISSRRQHFAPAVLLLLLCPLYSRQVKHKALFLAAISAAVLIVFGLQFWMRMRFTSGSGPEDFYEAVLQPQLIEFAAIGLTSFEAWNRFVLDGEKVTYGAHWLFHMLDSVPFLKLGSLLFPAYDVWLTELHRQLAPWGGLSMLADALLAGGITGLAAYAVVAGSCLWWWHTVLLRHLTRGPVPGIMSVYVVSLIVTLVPIYRSGLGVAIHALVSFTVLYFFLVATGVILMSQLRLAAKAGAIEARAAA